MFCMYRCTLRIFRFICFIIFFDFIICYVYCCKKLSHSHLCKDIFSCIFHNILEFFCLVNFLFFAVFCKCVYCNQLFFTLLTKIRMSRICLLFSWKAVDECLYFCFCDLMSTNCGDYFLFHNVLLFYSTMVQLYHLYFLGSKDIWYFIYFLFFIPFMH